MVVWMTHLFGLLGLTGVCGGAQAYGPSTWRPCTLGDTKKHCGYKAREDKALGVPRPRGGRWPHLVGTAAQELCVLSTGAVIPGTWGLGP